MKKVDLKKLIKEILMEDSLSTAEEIIDYIGNEPKPQHWSILYQFIKTGKLSIAEFHKILKHFNVEK